ncbi:DUF2206 domain-containing protein [Streptomyces cyaneochromogenes]|uniref:DUF2206 domain-containing protein n=1 Tax=Streptomyces cyaneochromogenes TaxID=2496836 RepID=A0A3Q9EYB1_9ACTN|nr:DUF2206 domain-containing protein [Streptomyces cyaneochromogenes]AZQ39039.1 DUF2206 domain-containing protein [Streptomyces cyaneochromogenes]
MKPVATATRRAAARRTVLGGTALAALVEFVPGAPTSLLTLAGLWLLLGAPIVLWYSVASRVVSTRDGGVLLAVGLTVIGDIVVALAVNTVLPLVGVARPLDRASLTIASALSVLVIAVVTEPPSERMVDSAWWRTARLRSVPGLVAVPVLGTVTLVLSVAGPIRLNNGLGSAVSGAALISVAALLMLSIWRRNRYSAYVVELALFCAAGGLLLLTSLRGWYVIGHDTQTEFWVFQVTEDADRWDMAAFPDPYNACLSITLLPTSLAELTAISGTYVFKVLLPLLFALTPVLVYRSVRNVAPQLVALLSAVYFMAMPTFFTDMTFLARQEVAFLLLGCVMVVVTDTGRPLRVRRVTVTVLAVGIVLSHYSTTYVVVVVLGLALVLDLGWRLVSRLRRRNAPDAPKRGLVTWWMVAAIAAATVVWVGPATQTSGPLQRTVATTARDLTRGEMSSRSSDTAYSLFGDPGLSPAQQLDAFRADSLRQTAEDRAAGVYPPLSVVERYPTPVVPQQDMPLTSAGEELQELGLDVTAANGFLRDAAARMMQVFLFIGVIVTVMWRHREFRPTRDQVTLTIGMISVIGLLTVLPQLSVDYGMLRAFQQGLIVFAPFVAAGSLWVFGWARRGAAPIACTLALALFLDLTGVIPKLFGGYPPQLHLNNAGQDYDLYYVHPEERTAVEWLEGRISKREHANVQSDQVLANSYAFSRLKPLIQSRAVNDFYPALVEKQSYVFLDAMTVRNGEAGIVHRGDDITYRYPRAFLDAVKNKVYSNGGAEIYR